MSVDLACAVHVHSVHSDGTGTVDEIAAAAIRAGVDCVLITDHDTTDARIEAMQVDGVLVGVGHEVSPARGSHLLAFGVEQPIRHLGRTTAATLADLHARGGVGFAAHPLSAGGWAMGIAGRATPYADLGLPIDGLEVWSLVTDTLERLRSPLALARFRHDPDAVLDALDGPPARNLARWDALAATRRMPGIGGLDAHVVAHAMAYETSFRLLRTHVLLEDDDPARPADAAAVVAALAAGNAYLARDSIADATGFAFATAAGVPMGAEVALDDGPHVLTARSPRPARLTLLRDGVGVAEAEGDELSFAVTARGVYRIEARLPRKDALWPLWVLSNHVYVR